MESFIEKEFKTRDMAQVLNTMSGKGYTFVTVIKQTKEGDGFFDSEWGCFVEYEQRTTAIFKKETK